MGKRKGVGQICGAKKKKRKAGKEDESTQLLAIKIAATTAVRPEWHDVLIPWITEKSIMATRICELASLLFLEKVRDRDEECLRTGDWTYFDEGDGEHIIESCFFAVLRKYKECEDMEPDFRHFVENLDAENRFEWPNNTQFGNYFKYLYQQYARNVVTNLTTHQQKRLQEYLKLKVWEHNTNSDDPNDVFDEQDIKNAVSWAIKRYDSTRGNADRLNNRDRLLTCVRNIGGPPDDDIATDTRDNWFASLPMWLHMQTAISDYHEWAQDPNNNPDDIKLPKIKNLSVIPIHSHQRKAVKICADVLYRMMCETKTIPKVDGVQIGLSQVTANKDIHFDRFFDLEEIDRMLKINKQFHYYVVSDGISVSILYKVSKETLQKLIDENLVKQRYYDGFYVYELGIDPGMKTWNSTVRRHIDSEKEMNFKISSKKYHYLTRQKIRDKKAEKWTREFTEFDEAVRNAFPNGMPSPKGRNWWDYIRYRLTIMKEGIETYTTAKYTRLRFDKYIESNRVCDKVAAMLTNGKPCIIFMGASQPAANSPIKIKKHVRAPGNRKLLKSFKKLANNHVIMVNENRTSRLCARCFEPFALATLSHRTKKCEWCAPDDDQWPDGLKLPTKIVSMKTKRVYQGERREMREQMIDHPHHEANGFVSKVICYRKNWRRNPANVMDVIAVERPADFDFSADYVPNNFFDQPEEAILNSIWHRDISAAKLIMYKGHCQLFGDELHNNFTRHRLVYPRRLRLD